MTLQEKYQEKFEQAMREYESDKQKELDELEDRLAEWVNIIIFKLEQVVCAGLNHKHTCFFPTCFKIEVMLEKNDCGWNLTFKQDNTTYGSNIFYASKEKVLYALKDLLLSKGILYLREGSDRHFFQVTFVQNKKA